MEDAPTAQDLTARLLIGFELHTIESANFQTPQEWLIEPLPEKDWLAESYKTFPPFEIGPFFIHGSHYDGDLPANKKPLQIDAATAFGSGEHGTTKGCLEAMIELKDQGHCPWNVLDMGTGSGILAIAAWKLWKTPILAVDNSEEAVRVAAHHQELNGVSNASSAMTCLLGDGFNTSEVENKKPFDLIIANILAGPLIDMAPALTKVADENAHIILSGMLVEQADEVWNAYKKQGLKKQNQINHGEWSTLVLQNTASS